jgi:hypothetical protein
VVRGKNSYLCVMNFVAASEKGDGGRDDYHLRARRTLPAWVTAWACTAGAGRAGCAAGIGGRTAARLDKLDLVAVLQVPKDQIRAKADQLVQMEHEKQQQEKQQGRRTR